MFQRIYVIKVLFNCQWFGPEDSPGNGDVVTCFLRPYRRIGRSQDAGQTRAETTLVGTLAFSIVDALLRNN
jgi:hypothetical protein